jgi:hypothetical protein
MNDNQRRAKVMNKNRVVSSHVLPAALGTLVSLSCISSAWAYQSPSTGSDGAFAPVASITVPLPPSGIFNYTDVAIPAGVTVTFQPNADNTPVRILATGDVVIDGVIDVAGGDASGQTPGEGGPGGYRGGRGGLLSTTGAGGGGDGSGPGGGSGANGVHGHAPGGASYGAAGNHGTLSGGTRGQAGAIYGNDELLPLLGGSGGGGAAGSHATVGAGGAGGGGALLVAATGEVVINGIIIANGGGLMNISGSGCGSGGAVRIIGSVVRGEGLISADRLLNAGCLWGALGGAGRIRIEADQMLRQGGTSPAYSFSPTPGVALLVNPPTIRIATVAGVSAPANPTGVDDVVVPGVTANPVAVTLTTSDVPAGTVITVKATPAGGEPTTAASTPVTADAATASLTLPSGSTLLTAQAEVTITATAALFLRQFTHEEIASVRVGLDAQGRSRTIVTTVSGQRFDWPS